MNAKLEKCQVQTYTLLSNSTIYDLGNSSYLSVLHSPYIHMTRGYRDANVSTKVKSTFYSKYAMTHACCVVDSQWPREL